jgi:hypothetical protein
MKEVSRTKTLHGIGNAIVPQVASELIGSYLDVLSGLEAA